MGNEGENTIRWKSKRGSWSVWGGSGQLLLGDLFKDLSLR